MFQVKKGTEIWSHIGSYDNSGRKGAQDLRAASAMKSDQVTWGFYPVRSSTPPKIRCKPIIMFFDASTLVLLKSYRSKARSTSPISTPHGITGEWRYSLMKKYLCWWLYGMYFFFLIPSCEKKQQKNPNHWVEAKQSAQVTCCFPFFLPQRHSSCTLPTTRIPTVSLLCMSY